MKTTIYELLGMIKDGKAPKKILFNDEEWEWYKFDYKNKNSWELFDEYVITDILDNEVIILEITITLKQDKKIENISEEEMKLWHEQPALYDDLAHKVKEIIEVLNER